MEFMFRKKQKQFSRETFHFFPLFYIWPNTNCCLGNQILFGFMDPAKTPKIKSRVQIRMNKKLREMKNYLS
jgi:hypothetical protein